MGRASPMQASVNAGELSPLMMGRVDQAVYSIAGERMENFVPLIQGPMTKRSGLRHVAEAKGPFRPIDFEFNTTQTYIIEAGGLYMRFFTNNAQIMDGDAPYELATPWSYEEMLAADFVQSGDVIYFVHGSHAPRTLTRTGAAEFALAALELRLGPFDDDNQDETVTVTASASSGDVTLYAMTSDAEQPEKADIFTPGHVGGLFKLEVRDLADVPSWEPDISVASGDLRQWEGKVYQAIGGAGRTGTVPPIHSDGVEWDGMGSGTRADGTTPAGGVQWLYLHDRFGILKITAFLSARKVSATVLKRLPNSAAAANSYEAPIGYTPPYTGATGNFYHRFDIVDVDGEISFDPTGGDYTTPDGTLDYAGPGTWRWAFGAFSEANGWPECCYIWNERLILAKGATFYGSVVGSYADFRERNDAGEITADMAFRFTLNSPNAIQWISGDEYLLLGTSKQEHVGGAAGGNGIPGPLNFKAPAHTACGSAKIKPLFIAGRLLFADKSGRRLQELDQSFERADRFDADDLTILASHITKKRMRWLAWLQAPHSLVWTGLQDGTLACMAYSPKQQVKGWSRVTLAPGSKAWWGACILDPEGFSSQLWLHVERDGRHWVQYLEAFWDAGDDQASAFFVDHGLSYDGDPATLISGLDHLAGETVAILADGAPVAPQIVTPEGTITLARAASRVHAGLYYPARFKSLRVEAGGDDGTAQGKIKRISKLVTRFLDTLGVRARVQGGEWEELRFREHATPADEAPALFTGDYPLDIIGDYDREGQIEFESIAPLPATILAITPTLKVGAS